ncbi:hypothetical protein IC229_23560 [Spirosoma sp. BT702]|uniref:Uncharacterized protein n=1 Tax=Spirosoma profusum TaxID=2771354 RepID=A0A926XZE9_9BACT|nr:hypothetical protein [Spirosoma profusum]MBD2703642.1 hypothetical protein [Spirosoma profusum]
MSCYHVIQNANLANSTVTNTIINTYKTDNVATTFCYDINCMSYLPIGNGNINGANWGTIFASGNPQVDINFRLAPGSIAQGAATGRTDIGAFAGYNSTTSVSITPATTFLEFTVPLTSEQRVSTACLSEPWQAITL